MPFITVGSIELEAVSITEMEPVLIGDETRSDNGTLRGAITDEKRKWEVELLEMAQADLNSLRALLAYGAHVQMAGDAIGSTLTVRGYLRSMPYVRDGASFLRTARLELVEV